MAENKSESGKAMSKSAIFQHLADSTKLTKKQVAEFYDALTALVKRELGKKGPGVFNVVPGMVQLKLKRMPASKARQAPNRFKPGEMMTIKAKPARNVVRPRALKALKELVK